MSSKKKDKDKISKFRKTWGYVIPYFLRYRGMLYFVIFLSLMASVWDPGLALLTDPFMDYYILNPEKGRSLLWVIPIAIILIFTFRAVFNFTSKYLLERICIKVVRDIQVALYNHYMFLSLDHYERTTTGKMIARTVNDVAYMQRIVPITIDVLHNVFLLLFLVGVCFYKEPYFSGIAILAIPVVIYPVQRISQAMKRYTKKGLKQVSEINSTMVETYSGAKVVKAFAMEQEEVQNYKAETKRLMSIQYRYAAVKHMISPLIGFVTAFAVAPIFYIGVDRIGSMAIQDEQLLREAFGSFSSFMVAMVLMYNPVRKLGTITGHFNSAYGAAERIRETLEQQSTVTEPEGAISIPSIQEAIEFQHVSFTYDKEKVLDDFSLDIKKGQLVALVGESGSGKSTVVNLLPRFYDIQEGSIKIDGHDIREATLDSLRLQIGMVTQETFLFATTVKRNIGYGSKERTEEEIVAAAKAAFAHDFIMELPDGYDTVIGERGVRLSGGQRQRLAIARALLKDPPILILDEATSALDTCAEREVQRALDKLMKNRTTIAIAHRLSTIRHADNIVVLAHGKVVEQGAHTELMKRDGEYKRLYEMQFFLGEYSTDHYGAGEEQAPAGAEGIDCPDPSDA